ncbi:MAG: hypothetical protein JWM75_1621 [Sphingomonas bacterium]|nr:hypothetical protein [Sphingomonas bacterium]
MTRRHAADPSAWGVAAVWLIVAVVLTLLNLPDVLAGTPADGDDYMRLLEVRDWIGGQSWWDVGQHRMNPPAGGLMHWSRIVDLPLALGFVALAPLVGQLGAETVTVTIVPLLMLGGVMALLAYVGRRLFEGPAAPVIAAMLVAMAGYVTVQLYPGRIDHHGWQLLMAATALAALLDVRPVRSGVVAGAALALWLNISIEGLPFAIAAAATVALRWTLTGPGEGRRLAALLGTLASASALLFVATHPVSGWGVGYCDAIAPAHLLIFAAAAAGSLLLVRLGGAWGWRGRALSLMLLGAACAAAFLSLAPGCAANPFGRLDPLVHEVWYLNVVEGLPIWRQTAPIGLNILFFPLVGLLGCAVAIRSAESPGTRRDWLTIAILLAASLGLAMLLRRAAGVAHLMAIPGALALIEPLRARAAGLHSPIMRALAGFAAIALPSPLTAIYASALFAAPAAEPATAAARCDTRCTLALLDALPPGEILTTIDAGPAVLAHTRHAILAAAYHRNDRAIADLIRAFTSTPDTAHAIIASRGIAYVLLPPPSGEATIYRARAPAGLLARLEAGTTPGWLQPIPLPGSAYRLWRVRG